MACCDMSPQQTSNIVSSKRPSEDATCPICLDDADVQEVRICGVSHQFPLEWIILPCGHAFHSRCVGDYFWSHANIDTFHMDSAAVSTSTPFKCPMCRKHTATPPPIVSPLVYQIALLCGLILGIVHLAYISIELLRTFSDTWSSSPQMASSQMITVIMTYCSVTFLWILAHYGQLGLHLFHLKCPTASFSYTKVIRYAVVAYALLPIPTLVAGIDTGIHAYGADHADHLDTVGRLPVEWHPRHAEDLQVMGLDRSAGHVVGYRRTTGKVFAGRRAAPPVVRIEIHDGSLLDFDCLALERQGEGRYAWRDRNPTLAGSYTERPQSWWIQMNSAFPAAVTKLRLRNSDYGTQCECEANHVRGEYRHSALYYLSECRPWDKFKESHLGHTHEHLIGRTFGRDTTKGVAVERGVECDAMTQSLVGRRVFVVGPDHRDVGETCSHERTRALSHAAHHSQKKVRSLDRLPAAPRARVLTDIKRTASLLDTVQITMATLSKVTTEAVAFAYRLVDSRNRSGYLHLHRHTSNLTRESYEEALDTYGVFNVTAPNKTYADECDPPVDETVERLLTSQVAMTPDNVNVTSVALAWGRTALSVMDCILPVAVAVGRVRDCTCIDAQCEAPRINEMMPQSGDDDVSGALASLRTSLTPERIRSVVSDGGHIDDHADAVVRTAMEASEALLRRAATVGMAVASLSRSWENLQLLEDDVVQEQAEDLWCCASEHVIDDARAPPCLPIGQRIAERTLERLLSSE